MTSFSSMLVYETDRALPLRGVPAFSASWSKTYFSGHCSIHEHCDVAKPCNTSRTPGPGCSKKRVTISSENNVLQLVHFIRWMELFALWTTGAWLLTYKVVHQGLSNKSTRRQECGSRSWGTKRPICYQKLFWFKSEEVKKEKRKRFPSLLRRLSLVTGCIDKRKSAKQVKRGSRNFYLEFKYWAKLVNSAVR